MKKLFCLFCFCALLFSGALHASQNSLVVPDGTGAQVRAGFNNALDSLNTLESGPSAPTTTEAYMLWADTTNNLLKQRDAANATWIVLGTLGAANLGLQPALPSGGTSGQYLRGDLTWQPLNLAALGYTVGTAANNLVQLNSSGQLPAVSGANLTNLPSTGGVSTQNVVTGSRAFNTVYHNTTGKPMMVSATLWPSGSGYCTAYTDANSSPSTVVAQINMSSAWSVMTFWVLPGNYYEITPTTAGVIECWTEWY